MFDRGLSFTVWQCHDRLLSVSNTKRVHAYVDSSSVRVESVDHSHQHTFHTEHVANAFTYDDRHTSHHVLQETIRNSFNFHWLRSRDSWHNEHPKFEDDVPQFSGKINEKFAEWDTDVKLGG